MRCERNPCAEPTPFVLSFERWLQWRGTPFVFSSVVGEWNVQGESPEDQAAAEEARAYEAEALERPAAWMEAASRWITLANPSRAELALLNAVNAGIDGAINRYGDLLTAQGNPKGARHFYSVVAPGRPKAYLALAELSATEGDDAGARDAYERSLLHGVPSAHRQYAHYLSNSGFRDEAVAVLQGGVATGVKGLQVELGNAYAKLGDDVRAEQAYVAAKDAGETAVFYAYASFLSARGDNEGALTLYEEAAATSPYYWAAAAEIRLKLGDVVGAEAALATGFAAGDHTCTDRLSKFLVDQNDVDGAIDVLETASKRGTNVALPLAELHDRAGNTVQARLAFESALDTAISGASQAYLDFLTRTGDQPDPLPIYRRAIAGGNRAEWLNQAMYFEGAGEVAQADLCLSEYLHQTHSGFAYQEYAAFLARHDDVDGALALLDDGSRRGQPSCHIEKAKILSSVGRVDEAIHAYEAVVLTNHRYAIGLYGNFLAEQGFHDRAGEVFERGAKAGAHKLWVDAAQAFGAAGNLEGANQAFVAARQARCNGASLDHAEFLLANGDPAAAEQVYLDDVSENPDLWLPLARLRQERGDMPGAKKAYTEAVRHDPRSVGPEFGRFLVENNFVNGRATNRPTVNREPGLSH